MPDTTQPDENAFDEFDLGPDFDPYDVEAFRANPPTVASAEGVILGITVRKPKKDEFIRVNADPAFILDASIVEHEGGSDRKADYLVPPHPKLMAYCEQIAGSAYKPVRIFTAMNKFGALFLWPARLPDDRAQKWHTTALAAAEEARTHWVRVQADMRAGMYRLDRAVADFGEPEWPDTTLSALLKLAFDEEHTITSPQHAVLRELRGEI